jgi:hypothetical protein
MARAVLEREVPATGSRQKMIVRDVALRKLADKALSSFGSTMPSTPGTTTPTRSA